MTSAHPPQEHNPHVWADLHGNEVTQHITDGTPADPVDADGQPVPAHNDDGTPVDEEVDEQWQETTEPAGTDSSTSSSTPDESSKSPEPSIPKPAPDAENPSESDPTTASTAPGATGDGTAPKTRRTRRSGNS